MRRNVMTLVLAVSATLAVGACAGSDDNAVDTGAAAGATGGAAVGTDTMGAGTMDTMSRDSSDTTRRDTTMKKSP